MDRCFKCEPLTERELEDWTLHSGFNAYRYGIDKFEFVKPDKATSEEVMDYLKWEAAWASNGIPG